MLVVTNTDAVALTQSLVRIDSSNPTLGSVPGPGEAEIARFIESWFQHRDIETHWIEPTKGRPSIVAIARGTGGGKSLMLNGHIDTVTTLGYDGNALSGDIKDGKLFGRGAADMKCGIGAAMSALEAAKKLNLRGDVIFTGVADEEATSIGTEQILELGWTADAAIVNEPTNGAIVNAHKGFVWLEVDFHGLAAHGSMPTLGVDAIIHAGHFLVELDKYSKRLAKGYDQDPLAAPSVHASVIKGGEEVSSYPALCTVTLERRTIPGETAESVRLEIQALLDQLTASIKDFRSELRLTFHRSPFFLPPDDAFAALVARTARNVTGTEVQFNKGPYWTDCALLADKGIPVLLFGATGYGLHSKEEWAEVESIRQLYDCLVAVIGEFCR